MTRESVLIQRRFHGPPTSGNGGYVCGLLAAHVEGPAAVRLRAPPPLEVELEVRHSADGASLLHDGATIAEARASSVELEVPAPPSDAEVEAGARAFRGFQSHYFPSCFVCGPERDAGDGLRIFAGPVAGRALVAAPWEPEACLGGPDGEVLPVFLWSALDCPGAFAIPEVERGVLLLGELAVALSGGISVGERCSVVAWVLGREGRKHFSGSALFSAAGVCQAVARATWFEVPDFHEQPSSEAK